MSPVATSILSILFVLMGITAVLIMLKLLGNPGDRGKGIPLRRIHRLTGYLFILLFAGIFFAMAPRLPSITTPLAAIHAALAFSLLALIVIKVAIARWFRRLSPQLTFLGLTIFTLAFVMVSVMAGIHLLPEDSSLSESSAEASLETEKAVNPVALLENRCSRCHTLDKVHETEKSVTEWHDTIARMSGYANDPQFLTERETKSLAAHLARRESLRKKGNDL